MDLRKAQSVAALLDGLPEVRSGEWYPRRVLVEKAAEEGIEAQTVHESLRWLKEAGVVIFRRHEVTTKEDGKPVTFRRHEVRARRGKLFRIARPDRAREWDDMVQTVEHLLHERDYELGELRDELNRLGKETGRQYLCLPLWKVDRLVKRRNALSREKVDGRVICGVVRAKNTQTAAEAVVDAVKGITGFVPVKEAYARLRAEWKDLDEAGRINLLTELAGRVNDRDELLSKRLSPSATYGSWLEKRSN